MHSSCILCNNKWVQGVHMNNKQNKLLQKIFFGNFLKYVINTIYQKALKRELNTKHFSTFCCLKNVKMLEWARFWENKCIIKKCLVSLWFEGSLQKSCFFIWQPHQFFKTFFFQRIFDVFMYLCFYGKLLFLQRNCWNYQAFPSPVPKSF